MTHKCLAHRIKHAGELAVHAAIASVVDASPYHATQYTAAHYYGTLGWKDPYRGLDPILRHVPEIVHCTQERLAKCVKSR